MLSRALFTMWGTVVAALAVSGVQGAEWFVDCSRPDDTGNGTSIATAKRTIQAAVDAAAADDTVTVLPGVYDEGGATFTASSLVCSNRVYIAKNLTLRSRDGAATTHIVGRKDPDSALYGIGPAAIRCIAVKNDGPRVTIEGFTLRDGSTRDGGDSVPVRGGAVLYTADAGLDKARAVTVRDCVIRDCSGTRGGAIYGVTAERCTFTGNYGKNFGAAARQCHLKDCVLYRNLGGTSVGVLAYGYTAVNCTIAYNEPVMCFSAFDDAGRWASNCLIRANGNLGISSKIYNSLTDGSVTVNGCRTMPTGEPLFVAPAAGDFRLNVAAAAVTNNPAVGIYCGAVQEAVACTGGKLFFKKPSSGSLYVNGIPVLSDVYAGASPWPASYAVTYTPAEGRGLVHYLFGGSYRWPGLDDVYHVIPPAAGSAEIAPVAGVVKYVSPDGDDTTATGAADAPYRTLQGAVNASSGATLLYAKPGIYDEGGSVRWGVSNRVTFSSGKIVRLKALDGSANTVISGAPDPEPVVANAYGLGPNAMRCLCFDAHGCAVQGFTLTGGRSSVNANNGDGHAVRGGAMYAFNDTGSYASAILDCVVSNNVASRGAAIFGGFAERCLLTENVVPAGGNGITRAVAIYSSVYTRNTSVNTIVGQTTKTFNCTVVSNYSANTQMNTDANTHMYNTVLAANAKSTDVDTLKNVHNTVFEKGTVSAEDCMQAITEFADYLGGDFRPYAMCPGSFYGDSLYWAADGHCFTDFLGRPFEVGPNGRITAGAVAELVPSVTVVETVPGAVSPIGRITDFPVTITVSDVGRQFLGFEVNGTTQLVSGSSLVLTAEQVADFTSFDVKPLFRTDWYVDAVHGDDANDGWTAETAKKTLAAAMRLAWSGDTVHALPGVYNEGDMVQDNPYLSSVSQNTTDLIRSRVVVQTNVTLIAEGSVDETVIEGRDADPSDSDNYKSYGKLGPTGMRAVYLNLDSTVKGFTIRKGRTDFSNSANQDDNNRGGGVLGRSAYARCRVEDCIISDCGAWRGAAGYYATFVRCRLLDNRSAGNSAIGRNVALYGCYASGNRESISSYNGILQEHGDIVGCTFAADNGMSSLPDGTISGGRLSVNQTKGAKFWSNVVAMPYSSSYLHVLSNACYNVFSDAMRFDDLEGTDNIVTNLAAIALGTDGVPQYGSVVINAGDWAYAETNRTGEVALNGVDRGLGGDRPDVGAFAFDWREQFVKDLGASHLLVSMADRAVYENADGKVAIPSGSLKLTWNPSSGTSAAPCSFKANVTGNGTLTVSKNGDVFGTYSAGTHDISFFGVNPVELELTYTSGTDDLGVAVLSDFRSANGTLFILR